MRSTGSFGIWQILMHEKKCVILIVLLVIKVYKNKFLAKDLKHTGWGGEELIVFR